MCEEKTGLCRIQRKGLAPVDTDTGPFSRFLQIFPLTFWVRCILAGMISLLLCSCTSSAREESAALDTMENLALLFEGQDSYGLKNAFAPFVIEQTNQEGALEEDIHHIMEYFSGSISSRSMKNYYVTDSVKAGGYQKEICATYSFDTDIATYSVRVLFRAAATGEHQDTGILMLEIWNQEDIDKAVAQNTSDELDKFKFHSVDGYIGIWYPTERSDGTIQAGTNSGIKYTATNGALNKL